MLIVAHGAQVLLITSPNLPSLPLLDVETSVGKRTTQVDLDPLSSDKEKLRGLVKDADVFLQAYRPAGLESRGFGVDDVVKMKEGGSVVYASLRAWGWNGTWANRRGVSICMPIFSFHSWTILPVVRFFGSNSHRVQRRRRKSLSNVLEISRKPGCRMGPTTTANAGTRPRSWIFPCIWN